MKTNFGTAKASVSNRFTNALLESEKSMNHRRAVLSFSNLLKSSSLMKAMYQIYENIESAHIPDQAEAKEYLKENLTLVRNFTAFDYDKIDESLESFVDPTLKLNETTERLYENLHVLIISTLKGNTTTPDINSLWNANKGVIKHLTEAKISQEAETNDRIIAEDANIDQILTIAVKKFNEKYAELSESERKALITLTLSPEKEKIAMFESLKTNGLEKLNSLKGKGVHEDKVNESIEQIKSMAFNKKTLVEDFMRLDSLNML